MKKDSLVCSVEHKQSREKALQATAEQERDKNHLRVLWSVLTGPGSKSIGLLQKGFLLTPSVAWILFQDLNTYVSEH